MSQIAYVTRLSLKRKTGREDNAAQTNGEERWKFIDEDE